MRESYRTERDATFPMGGNELKPYDPSQHTLELDPGLILGAWRKYKSSRKDTVCS